MKNHFIQKGHRIVSVQEYDLNYSENYLVLLDAAGSLLHRFPVGIEESVAWQITGSLAAAWLKGFKSGQEDLKSRLLDVLQPSLHY